MQITRPWGLGSIHATSAGKRVGRDGGWRIRDGQAWTDAVEVRESDKTGPHTGEVDGTRKQERRRL